MNKIFNLLLITLFLSACSLNKNSNFWTSEKIEELEKKKFQKIFDDEKKTDWIAMMDKLDKEHTHIVDLKKELDNSLEKMISVTTLKKYQVAVPRKRRFSDTHFLRRQKEEESGGR